MNIILRYIISVVFCWALLSAVNSQDFRKRGLRLGVDVSRFAMHYINPEREGFEVSADFEVLRKTYLTVEYGQLQIDLEKPEYNYYSDGSYYRFGFDYNFQKNTAENPHDMIFGGLRYGISNFTHSADNIVVSNGFWGDYTNGSIAENSLKAQWIEIEGGIRAELIKNIFMGWSVRGRLLVHKTQDEYMQPYIIPGFGKGSKKSRFGFNFSIFIKIPMFKEKTALSDTVIKKSE